MSVDTQMESAIQGQALAALVVDDDELTQELLHEMLSDLGFTQVQSALNGRQALNRLTFARDIGLTQRLKVIGAFLKPVAMEHMSLALATLTNGTEAH